jgi:hypothetical protein
MMKYANLILKADNFLNIGDTFQILAIENLYRYMGVNYDDIVRINVSDLSSYRGNKVVLPLNYPLFGYYNLSEDIVPVFLGVSMMTGLAAKGLKCSDFLPVGCRDIHTYRELQKLGLDAYNSGCLTLTFPQRTDKKLTGKVLWVDAPNELMPYIPKELQSRIEKRTHIFYHNCPDENQVKEIYKMYQDESQLVVTSKIHCAMPCLSAGIPVIFACESPSFRYSVLSGLIPVHTPKTFSKIDWYPRPADFEGLKNIMLGYASQRVERAMMNKPVDNSVHSRYQKQLNSFFCSDTVLKNVAPLKNVTVSTFEKYLQTRYDTQESFKYVLWGVTQIAELTYEMITTQFPQAELVTVIDMFRKTSFHGIKTADITELAQYQDIIVFVTVGGANPIAEEYMAKFNISKYCVCYGGLHIEDGKRISANGII